LKGVAQVEIVLGALPPANLNVTENDVQAWPFLAEIFQLSQLRAKKAIPHECEFAHFLVKSWHRSPLIKIPCCHSQGCGIAAVEMLLWNLCLKRFKQRFKIVCSELERQAILVIKYRFGDCFLSFLQLKHSLFDRI
jgi:hypothetical protein